MTIYSKTSEHTGIGHAYEHIKKTWRLDIYGDMNFDDKMRDKFMAIDVVNDIYVDNTNHKPRLWIKGGGTRYFTFNDKNPMKKKVFDLVVDFLKDDLLPETLITNIK